MKAATLICFLNNLTKKYNSLCKPVCKEMGINQTSFDIILFLANNPEYTSARDISTVRGIKPNLVSFTVEKLVKDGFLIREAVKDDRRKVSLRYTEKARPIIDKGRIVQEDFARDLLNGISKEHLLIYNNCMNQIKNNLNLI